MSKNNPSGRWQIVLSCRHVHIHSYRLPGTVMFCPICGRTKSVDFCRKLYYWVCTTCGQNRGYVDERLAGERGGQNHWAANRDHVVVFGDCDGKRYWESPNTPEDQRTREWRGEKFEQLMFNI